MVMLLFTTGIAYSAVKCYNRYRQFERHPVLSPQGGGQVKGKQVRILYDLVTVSREQEPGAYARSLGNREGGCFVWICKPGNLPDVGTGMRIPDHEALIVPFLADREAGRKFVPQTDGVFLLYLILVNI